MVEHFRPLGVFSPPYRPLWFFRPLAHQNRPQGGDSAHFEKHCSRTYIILFQIIEMFHFFGRGEVTDKLVHGRCCCCFAFLLYICWIWLLNKKSFLSTSAKDTWTYVQTNFFQGVHSHCSRWPGCMDSTRHLQASGAIDLRGRLLGFSVWPFRDIEISGSGKCIKTKSNVLFSLAERMATEI